MARQALDQSHDQEVDYGFPRGLEHLTFEEFIQEGEDDIAAGRIVSHADVVAHTEELLASFRKS